MRGPCIGYKGGFVVVDLFTESFCVSSSRFQVTAALYFFLNRYKRPHLNANFANNELHVGGPILSEDAADRGRDTFDKNSIKGGLGLDTGNAKRYEV